MKKKKELNYGILPPGFYMIEKLLDKRRLGKINQYLVSWEGWGSEKYSWVEEKGLPKFLVSKFETYLKSRAKELSKLKNISRRRKFAPKLILENISLPPRMKSQKRKRGKKDDEEREMPELDAKPRHWDNHRNPSGVTVTSPDWPLYESSGRKRGCLEILTSDVDDFVNQDPVEAHDKLESGSGSASRNADVNDLHIPELRDKEVEQIPELSDKEIKPIGPIPVVLEPQPTIVPEDPPISFPDRSTEDSVYRFNLLGLLRGWNIDPPQNDISISESESVGGAAEDPTIEEHSLVHHVHVEMSSIQEDFDVSQGQSISKADAHGDETDVPGSFEPPEIEDNYCLSSPPTSPDEPDPEPEGDEIMFEFGRVNSDDISQNGGPRYSFSEAETVRVSDYSYSFVFPGGVSGVDDSLQLPELDESSDEVLGGTSSSIREFQNPGYSEIIDASPLVFRRENEDGLPPTMMQRTFYLYRDPECSCDCHLFDVEIDTEIEDSSYEFHKANDVNDYDTMDHVEPEGLDDSGFLSCEDSQYCSSDIYANNQSNNIDEPIVECIDSPKACDQDVDDSHDEDYPDTTTNNIKEIQVGQIVCTCAECSKEAGILLNENFKPTLRCVRPERTQIFLGNGKIFSISQGITDNVDGQRVGMINGVVKSVFNGRLVICKFLGNTSWQLVRLSVFYIYFPAEYERILKPAGVESPVPVPVSDVQVAEVGSSGNDNVVRVSAETQTDTHKCQCGVRVVGVSIWTQTEPEPSDVTGVMSVSVGTQTEPHDVNGGDDDITLY